MATVIDRAAKEPKKKKDSCYHTPQFQEKFPMYIVTGDNSVSDCVKEGADLWKGDFFWHLITREDDMKDNLQ